MGSKLSIDKQVSKLEDLLELNTALLDIVKYESNIPDCITQHLKIWKFHEDRNRRVRSEPINLSQIQQSGFNFLSTECYLVLLVYKKAHEEYNQFTNFPHQMWGVVESYSNLTPRGLGCPVATSESHLESFLLPKRQQAATSVFEYMIFVWNGKQANPLIKAQALSNAFELEHLLNRGKDPLLRILFSGCIVRNKSLSKGAIMSLESSAQEGIHLENQRAVRETVYLFNFLFPVQPEKQRPFSKLADFLDKRKQNYEDLFLPQKLKSALSRVDLPMPQIPQPAPPANPAPAAQKSKVPAINIPKLDFSCKTNQKEVKIQVPLIEESEILNQAQPLIPQCNTSSQSQAFSSQQPVSQPTQPPQLAIQNQSMKLSLGQLKLPLNRDETTYSDIEHEDSNGFNFDIRDTDRKKLKIQHFAEICSQIIPDFLYVGGEQIAYNREVLKQLGVTHVINCAGDVCKNKFPNDFGYTTYYLKDSKTENIECIFYEVFNIIESVRKNNGRVLIHCVQGVSRSVTLCIAYLIMTKKIPYQDAFDLLRKNRGVASPNMGFTVQLLLFQKRLQNHYDNFPINPRVFAVGRGISGPQSLVCRFVMEQLFQRKEMRTFDSRGVFLVLNEKHLFIWIGPECIKQDKYVKHAMEYVSNLRKYERAPLCKALLQKAYEESEEFWALWGETPQMICQRVREWNSWYDEIDEEVFLREKETTQRIYGSDRQEEQSICKMGMFYFPNAQDQITMVDLEDLDQKQLCLLMKEEGDRLDVFIWRGLDWEGDEEMESNFLSDVINAQYSHISHDQIMVRKEVRKILGLRTRIRKARNF